VERCVGNTLVNIALGIDYDVMMEVEETQQQQQQQHVPPEQMDLHKQNKKDSSPTKGMYDVAAGRSISTGQ
jgi:hypothetical protein